MSSTLKKLWNHAKGSENDRLENFTTEALAAAIRVDPQPLAEVLRRAGALDLRESAVYSSLVHTQVPVKGAGVVDLVVTLEQGDKRQDFWIEVKVEAGEHNGQLARYAAHLDKPRSAARPQLILLSPKSFKTEVELTQIRWQNLRDAIARVPKPEPHWADLRRFMEEFKMADKFEERITAREAGVQADAFALLRKLDRAIRPAVEHAAKLMPAWEWTKPKRVLHELTRSFLRSRSNLVVSHATKYKAGLSMGSFAADEETWLGVNVWCDPKDSGTWREIRALTEKLPGEHWASSVEDWDVVAAYEYLAAFDTQEEMKNWLVERLEELQNAGIISLIPKLGRAEAGDRGPLEDMEDSGD